jgi:hypothetical protein
MSERTRIEDVLRFLGLEDSDLVERMRGEGLFEADELSAFEAEELRLAAHLMRELDVNPAGVEVILHLRKRLLALQERMERVLRELLDES